MVPAVSGSTDLTGLERGAMGRALSVAWRGWGRVHPNPMVGAVILRDGRMAAEGWHAEYGGLHAETAALDALEGPAAGATMVVTLEPCRHQGKQPPCTDAILRAGIRRVVIGTLDPGPVSGGGAAELEAAGVEVVLADSPAVRRQSAAFFRQASGATRPFVALKLATSVDGMIAEASGRSRWLSGPEARDWVHWLRAGFDAIAVGGETARRDDPALTVRGAVTPRIAPARVVFSRSGLLAPAERFRSGEPGRALVVAPSDPGLPGAEWIEAGSLEQGLNRLHGAGITSLLVEGGGVLAGALLAAGLVDRFYWIQCPLWLGAGGRPAFAGHPGAALEAVAPWTPIERRALGADTLLVLEP